MNGEALYVEIDPNAAEWLRALILMGHIASGDVYCGSLEDLTPEFCNRYTQVHLCAGIGVWSLALRDAGWPDDRPVWTASFPCQPFSAAGQGHGFADKRHLWPSGFWLIEQCRPVVLLGEQVASKPGLEWFDLVSTDLEGSGYTVGAHDLCAAGVGAPHIRQRLYFVAHAGQERREWGRPSGPDLVAVTEHGGRSGRDAERAGAGSALPSGEDGYVVDAAREQVGLPRCSRLAGGPGGGGVQHAEGDGRVERGSEPSGRGSPGSGGETGGILGDGVGQGSQERQVAAFEPGTLRIEGAAVGPTELVRGRWAGADWIWCRDGKYRPVESGTFPLAHGAPARVGRLRGYGNAIVAPVAQAFIEAVMACL